MRLSAGRVAQLPGSVERYSYDRDAQAIGIVHFGIGAFHRAHQAWYTDRAMDAGDRDWAICGVSLRSPDVARQLEPQDGLYTLTAREGGRQDIRLVGAVREVLFAPDNAGAVVARIAAPECRIVSFTVTEKGYARDASGGLDLAAAQAGFYPLLARALELRMARGLPGITLLSCDNLAGNGTVLRSLVREWLAARSPEVLGWFDRECTVPSTMIDRIVPRTTAADRAALADRLGMVDAGAVFTETFSQWVIEDDFASGRPAWEAVGAQMVGDVAPYETAKLRILNGAHSLLAYCGLRAGHEFVHEAIADPALRGLADALMREEAPPTIDAPPDLDLAGYADRLVERFANPSLRHALPQIAMDGTQKIPQRWLDTALWLRKHDRAAPALRAAMEGWLWHLADGRFVDDPLGPELAGLAQQYGRAGVLDRCFSGSNDQPPLWPGYEALRALFL